MIEQVHEFRFSSVDLPIATMRQRLATIAERFNLKIDRWDEDGLGPAQGIFIRLAPGRVALLRELEHAIKHHGVEGPTIYVEGRDLAKFGVGPLITEVLETLGLSKDELYWIAPDENREMARDLVARVDRWLTESSVQPDRPERER
jgi:hypothetical protein